MKTKNKTRYLQSILGAVVAVSAALVLSCVQPDGPPTDALSGKGSVTLSVSTGITGGGPVSKTILPSVEPDFTKYKLEFSKGDPLTVVEELTQDNVTPEAIATGVEVELEAGSWTVTVTAYQEFDLDGEEGPDEPVEYEAAKGHAAFTVAAGELEPVTVDIGPIPVADVDDSLKGFFTYQVDFPADATGTLALTLDEQEKYSETLTSEAEVTVELPPGYYDLTIALTKADGKLSAGVSEKVHVYAGLVSKRTEGAFVFTDADFSEVVYLGGPSKLPEGAALDTEKTNSVTVYSDAEYKTAIEEATKVKVAADEWIVNIPVDNLPATKVYIKVELTDDKGYAYTLKGDTGEAVPETGLWDLNLDAEITPPDEPAVEDLEAVIQAAATDGAKVILGDVDIVEPEEAATLDLGTANVTVTGALTVPENVTVEVGGALTIDGGELNVGTGAEVTVTGELDLRTADSILVAGTVAINNNGTLKIDDSSTENFYGEEPDYTAGSFVFAYGSTVYSNEVGGIKFLGNDDDAKFKWDTTDTTGELVLTAHKLALTTGKLTVKNVIGITAGDTATIASGATLNVAAPFYARGTLEVAGTLAVETDGTLAGATNAKIVVTDGSTITADNFYDAAGTAIVETIGVGTYDWDGTKKNGWLKEATWTAEADGTEDTVTSTKITLTFSREVTLTGEDVTISGEGSADKGDVEAGEGNTWVVNISNVTAGDVTVSISKTGIEPTTTSTVTLAKDTTAPADVTSLDAAIGYKEVTLTWEDPEDGDLDHIEITYTDGTEKTGNVSAGTETATITGLTAGTSYTFTVKTVDGDGNESEGQTDSATPYTTYTAEANGEADYTTSTTITLTLADVIEGLSLATTDIAITDSDGNTGTVNDVSVNGTAVTVTITGVTAEGDGSITITKAGIDPAAHTVTLHYSTKGKQGLGVEADGLEDAAISITGLNGDISWSAKTALTVGVTLDEGTPSAYRWELDGKPVGTGNKPVGTDNNSLTGTTRQLGDTKLTVGKHSLTVFVTIDGVEYTKRTTFTVGK